VSIEEQSEHLIDLGVAELADLSADDLRGYASRLPDDPDAILAIHPSVVPASRLAPLLVHDDKPGFVVSDLTDLDQFGPIVGVEVPNAPLYLLHDVQRGDEMRNWSPDEALPAITSLDRSPLTISEGVSWLLQEPTSLARNHCFMTIASRLVRGSRVDARTPAIWLSGGTGRDGRANKSAPKIGWCWAANRHTWLGFASASHRSSGAA
jgi:hypothetical protein